MALAIELEGITPSLKILGNNQRFIFGANPFPEPEGSFRLDNIVIPTNLIPSETNSEIRNNTFSGFRWKHTTNLSDTYGSLKLQSFVNAQATGTDLMLFNQDGSINFIAPVTFSTFSISGDLDMATHKIINLGAPTSGADATTKNYVDTAIAAISTITLTGAVTGSGIGTIATTLTPITTSQISNFNASVTAFRLDQFAAPTASVSLGSQKIINLLNPTSNTDATNKVYVDSKTWTTSVITDFNSAVTAFRLDQFAIPTSNINLNNRKIINLLDPTSPQDAATKAYVDNFGAGGISLSGAVTGSGSIGTPITTILSNSITRGAGHNWIYNTNSSYPIGIMNFDITSTSVPIDFKFSFTNIAANRGYYLGYHDDGPNDSYGLTRFDNSTLEQIWSYNSVTIGGSALYIYPHLVISGTGGVTIPRGTTAQRTGGIGTIRLNTTTNSFEGTADGTTWAPFSTGANTVTSVSGTATRVSSTGGNTPVIDLIATAVTAGSYTNTNLTVDAYGRITAAANGSSGNAGTVTSVDISTSSGGAITVGGGPITASGTLTVNISPQLEIISALSSTGLIARTGSISYANVVITGTTNQVTVVNGNGVGNPTISIAGNAVLPGTGGITLPIGTTAQRLANLGVVRWNSTLALFEGYTGSTWARLDNVVPTITLSGDISGTGSLSSTIVTTLNNVIARPSGTVLNYAVNGGAIFEHVINSSSVSNFDELVLQDYSGIPASSGYRKRYIPYIPNPGFGAPLQYDSYTFSRVTFGVSSATNIWSTSMFDDYVTIYQGLHMNGAPIDNIGNITASTGTVTALNLNAISSISTVNLAATGSISAQTTISTLANITAGTNITATGNITASGTFYGRRPSGIISMYGNATTTPITSTGSRTKVLGATSSTNLYQFDSPTSNRLRYTGTPTVMAHVVATITVSDNSALNTNISMSLWKNGTTEIIPSIQFSSVTTSGFLTNITTSTLVSMGTNDYIEVYVGSNQLVTLSISYLNLLITTT